MYPKHPRHNFTQTLTMLIIRTTNLTHSDMGSHTYVYGQSILIHTSKVINHINT